MEHGGLAPRGTVWPPRPGFDVSSRHVDCAHHNRHDPLHRPCRLDRAAATRDDEQARRIFKAHHRLLSDAVEAHGSNEVKCLGDGLMVDCAWCPSSLKATPCTLRRLTVSSPVPSLSESSVEIDVRLCCPRRHRRAVPRSRWRWALASCRCWRVREGARAEPFGNAAADFTLPADLQPK